MSQQNVMKRGMQWTITACMGIIAIGSAPSLRAQSLEQLLQQEDAKQLASAARKNGDAARGAVVFFQPHMACSKCHSVGQSTPSALGPDLSTIDKMTTDDSLVESVLLPSKVIRQGYQSVTIILAEGTTRNGLVVEQSDKGIQFKDIARAGDLVKLATSEVDEVKINTLSIMPAGQVNQLSSRQQFLDLICYLIEVRDGGAERARQLQPSPTLLTLTLPEYEQHLDHAGLIRDWNADSLKRGEAIYRRVCANCHGTKDQVGSLPTSLRFAEGKFKNGSDPLAMYNTLTRGFGLMAAQTWMVPSQKYDVIHYIRETYLRPHNPSQFVAIDAPYLAKIPKGDSRGPAPSKIEPWSAMDYGPTLTHTYEVPGRKQNLAYKGIAIRLDPGAGGVSRGSHWTVFDTDTLRTAANWSGDNQLDAGDRFIDWRGIQMNGEHQIHPHLVGKVSLSNSAGPGWANPKTGAFADNQRVEGRDGLRYGPLPRGWARFKGLYHFEQRAILSYSVGTTQILESPRLVASDDQPGPPVFVRTFNVGPREQDLLLQVAEDSDVLVTGQPIEPSNQTTVLFPVVDAKSASKSPNQQEKFAFDEKSWLELKGNDQFDITTSDVTVVARIKTSKGGSIFSIARPDPKWTPDGQTLFIRDGRLCFDIGWVGVVTGRSKIDDNQWHDVAMTRDKATGRIQLFVDGRVDAEGTLSPKNAVPNPLIRIGFTAADFPNPTHFRGEIADVRFFRRRLTDELKDRTNPIGSGASLVARWTINDRKDDQVPDASGHKYHAQVHSGQLGKPETHAFGILPKTIPATWNSEAGRLILSIPAGREPLKFSVWTSSATSVATQSKRTNTEPVVTTPDENLELMTHGGPARWPQKLETATIEGTNSGAFAADILTSPDSNPWLAQMRLSGLDFLPDGRIAICTWDGDVWMVETTNHREAGSSTKALEPEKLRWQRIGSGLFQPLGLKVVNGKIHIICRDQLAVLHDLNGDGETDFYECLNNDHQVTEHFHEFAMGLQTDEDDNFYYAKSGRHALKAVVPHHGTLLRVTKDGSRTDILATGFRAANGVCLNPDGSFVVTDQEGFWNPKNRINWVTLNPTGPPKFYGNMFGYHDVTDSSDSAMEPPLCWITNAFDRSPAELLWVPGNAWGPLGGSLLNLSYGYGKVFVVPHERVNGTMQGGMIELPITPLPTGVMRGRFHPSEKQLYLCGMFAWAGNATQPGGFYRLRATGLPMHLPTELHATKSGLKLGFTDPVEAGTIDRSKIQIQSWSLKRTEKYGSEHFDEKSLKVVGTELSPDGKTLFIKVDQIQPTWGMEIKYTLGFTDGATVSGKIHNTIHSLGE